MALRDARQTGSMEIRPSAGESFHRGLKLGPLPAACEGSECVWEGSASVAIGVGNVDNQWRDVGEGEILLFYRQGLRKVMRAACEESGVRRKVSRGGYGDF